MEYLICYDIKDDKIRTKVAKYLESVAIRFQYSVFICNKREADLGEIEINLKNFVSNSQDASVCVYPICNECKRKVWQLGKFAEVAGYLIV